MQFIDKVDIKIKAGKGGDGLTSFRRERHIAKGGPYGGDGGNGGSVIFKADHNLNTLAEYRQQTTIKAENGEAGKNQKKHGKNGEDQIVNVPVGTVIYEDENPLADLRSDGEEHVAVKGGRGGFGNAHFKSSVRQTPRVAEIGEPGEEKEVSLELKILADVGRGAP